jgi:transcriptional regulator with XRE-family HTH domain
MITFRDVWEKLSNKEYREHYALSLLKRSVAFQIKTLRKKHCGSQAELAEAAGITQGVVSRAEDQDYGNLTFNTVGRIAGGLDMAFIGRFVPFSDLAKFSINLSEEQFANIPTFEEENAGLGLLAQTDSSSGSSFQGGNVAASQGETESNSGDTERKPMGTVQQQARTAKAGSGGR